MPSNNNPYQLSVDPNSLPDIYCRVCMESGNRVVFDFMQAFRHKYLSPLVSPNGSKGVVHIQGFVCVECGTFYTTDDLIEYHESQNPSAQPLTLIKG